MKKYKNLVVGCGFSGSVMARKIADELQEDVLVIDRKSHLAGNSYDYKENDITVHKYGPHIFHTSNSDVWHYLSRFTKWKSYSHEVEVKIFNDQIPLPFNLNSLHKSFRSDLALIIEDKLISKYGLGAKIPILDLQKEEDEDLRMLASFIYEEIFLPYTTKQWGLSPEDIEPSVTARVPVFVGRDNRYFHDKYQGIPSEGYTNLIKNMLDHHLIDVETGLDFSDVKQDLEYKRLFYTGSIDEFFDYKYSKLPYRSIIFELEEHELEFFQNKAVINYPKNVEFTRITEFKHFLEEKSSKTLVMKEYPVEHNKDLNERLYPIAGKDNDDLYQRYLRDAQVLKETFFFGRLGDYKYYNMDKAVERALVLFESIKKGASL